MSEFSSANLILKENERLIEEYDKYDEFDIIIKEIDEKWIAFLIEDVYIESEVPANILELSQKFPIFYFLNYEDYCWGYRIISNGNEVASLMVDYELEFKAIVEGVQKLYPHKDEDAGEISQFICFEEEGRKVADKVRSELLKSESYMDLLAKQFANKNVQAFKMFGISDETIKMLKDILTVEYFLKLKSPFELIWEFKKILKIEKVEWISYDYA